MDIRFISTLTAEDENMFAPALLKAIGALLDQLPIAYTVRIETTGAQIFHYSHAGPSQERPLTAAHPSSHAAGFPAIGRSGGAADVRPEATLSPSRHLNSEGFSRVMFPASGD